MMHLNYYFLKQLSNDLKNILIGKTLMVCFSQNKDELILGFANENTEFWIKATLFPDFTCLSFPKDFQRSKKNSVDLFKNAIGKTVQTIQQFENERCFSLVFENENQLVLKMFGNRANILWAENDQVTDIFHHKFAQDLQIIPSQLHRKIDQSENGFLQNGIKKTFPTFSKEIFAFLNQELPHFSEQNPNLQWNCIQKMLLSFEKPTFYLVSKQDIPELILFESNDFLLKTSNAVEALNEFYYQYSKFYFGEKEKVSILKKLEKKLVQTENYLQKTKEKLKEITTEARYEEMGHLIMANLHSIPPKSEKVVLLDFYTNQNIEIKLKSDLNAQKNAEWYYKKSKNQRIEVEKLQNNLVAKEEEWLKNSEHLTQISNIENLRVLKKYLKINHLETESEEEVIFPFKRFEFMNYQIWVGKNAQNNDLLLQRYTYKEDLWLHAKDVSGSHVIIKHQSGKNFPNLVIEKAASLAAYYSQRRNETLCPVIVTPRKFVRKTKDLPAGAVLVEKEEVIMIEPAPFE